jgi:beta-fructofuranosidase
MGHNPMPRGLSLPKVLTLRPDGKLAQHRLEELKQLRGEHYGVSGVELANASYVIDSAGSDLLEIMVEFEPGSASEFGIKIRCSKNGQRSVQINYDGTHLIVAGKRLSA